MPFVQKGYIYSSNGLRLLFLYLVSEVSRLAHVHEDGYQLTYELLFFTVNNADANPWCCFTYSLTDGFNRD